MTKSGTWWQRLGAALFALVLTVLTLGPGLDSILCGDETGMSAAAAAQVVAGAAVSEAADVEKGSVGDRSDHGSETACVHGHCHHGVSYPPVDVRVTETFEPQRTHHALLRSRVAVSNPHFMLIRPPRA